MSTRILIKDHPHRTLALVTEDYALVFRHTHDLELTDTKSRSGSNINLPAQTGIGKQTAAPPRCMVEFAQRDSVDLQGYRTVTSAKGTLGLITLGNDVFICIITGSYEVAEIRPSEFVQHISSVEFYCLNRADYDQGHDVNPYPGQVFSTDDDTGGASDQSEATAEHPFQALKKLFNTGHFYYSVDCDLTRRLQERSEDSSSSVDIASLDEGLLWNSYMISPLLQFRSRLTNHERIALDQSRLLTSCIRGFVKTLRVPASSSPIRHKVSSYPAHLTVISRLSSRRAGTRFNSRGVDDDGNVANFVETETVFWSPAGLCFSYVQVRGSIPIFWESQSSLIPGQQKVQITRSPEATQPAFDKHFAMLERRYGAVHIVNLLSAFKPGEVELTERYRLHTKRNPLTRDDKATDMAEESAHELLRQTEFDFHERTKGAGGYEGARAIRPYIDESAEGFGYFLTELDAHKTMAVTMQQNGAFRVNCLDCLDRTNLVQGLISQMGIELFLSHRDERGNPDFWVRHSSLWADNGDALSKIYAGTGALKSSFTRHGKMSFAGALADVRKSATRLYVNHFADAGKQNTVDLLLGRLVGQNSVDLFDPVNDWVVAEVAKRRAEFESQDRVKVWVGTHNLNGRMNGIDSDLRPWLDVAGAQIVVVAFQEIVELSPQQIMSTDPGRRLAWEGAVIRCLNGEKTQPGEEYILLRSGQLVGAALMVFVKAYMLDKVKNVEGAIKKTGMSGMAGNKGAVAIRMEVESTSVCFVTAHLAAGFGNYDERNKDYATIVSGLRFQRDRSIEDHEVMVWAGDFNYRIGLGYEKAKGLVEKVRSGGAIAEGALEKLYENDQLNIQMVVGHTFPFYREGKVAFLPTYKFDLGRDDYDSSEKARIPAWTDRILWKVTKKGADGGSVMKQLEYNSVMSMRFSDHRPVYARFELGVRSVDEAKKSTLVKKLFEKRTQDVGANLIELNDDSSSVDDDLQDYDVVEHGMPPASSDNRKWWLDGNKGAKSSVRPPGSGFMLNEKRNGNPWRDGGESDWIEVDKAEKVKGPKPEPPPPRGTKKPVISTDAGESKPELPPQRVTKKMAMPPWDDSERAKVNDTIEQGQRIDSETTPVRGARIPAAPYALGNAHERRTSSLAIQPPASTRTARSPSVTSVASLDRGLRKLPPAKPLKPSILTTSSGQVAVPQLDTLPAPTIPRIRNLSQSQAQQSHERRKPLPSRTASASSQESPPPLPVRQNSSSTIDHSQGSVKPLRKLPPPFQPRRTSGFGDDGPVSEPGSDAAPPLPARPGV